MLKKDKNLERRIMELGKDYRSKVIDSEKCGYYYINANYDIEISGIHNNKLDSNLNGCIYVWFKRQIVEKLPFKNFEEVKFLMKKLINHYDKSNDDEQKILYGRIDNYYDAKEPYYCSQKNSEDIN